MPDYLVGLLTGIAASFIAWRLVVIATAERRCEARAIVRAQYQWAWQKQSFLTQTTERCQHRPHGDVGHRFVEGSLVAEWNAAIDEIADVWAR